MTRKRTEEETEPSEYIRATSVNDPRGDGGYFALIAEMVADATHDLQHECSRYAACQNTALDEQPQGRNHRIRCDVKQSGQQFLDDLRSGRAGLWTQWLDLASLRTEGPAFTLSDDEEPTVRHENILPSTWRNRHERGMPLAVREAQSRGYLTMGEVAKRLNCSGARVTQLANMGRLKCIRNGARRIRLFEPVDVQAFLLSVDGRNLARPRDERRTC